MHIIIAYRQSTEQNKRNVVKFRILQNYLKYKSVKPLVSHYPLVIWTVRNSDLENKQKNYLLFMISSKRI